MAKMKGKPISIETAIELLKRAFTILIVGLTVLIKVPTIIIEIILV